MRISTRALLCWFACLALLAGCGGNGNGGNLDDCLLNMTLTGGLDENLDWNLKAGCGGSARDDQISLGFGILVTDLNIKISARGISPGDLKTDIPGQVHITHVDGREWATEADACSIDIHENELIEQDQVGDHYRVGGSGNCDMAAQPAPDNTTPAVDIPDFTFRAGILW